MPDQKPPRLDADERKTLSALLQYLRDSLVRKVEGVNEAVAHWPLVESGTTLVWLVKHLTRTEMLWVAYRFAGEDIAVPDDTVGPEDTIGSAVDAYRSVWEQVDAIVRAAPSLEQLNRRDGDRAPVNLRWVLMHLLEETARHAGHADILRELIDGSTGR